MSLVSTRAQRRRRMAVVKASLVMAGAAILLTPKVDGWPVPDDGVASNLVAAIGQIS